MQIFVHGGDYPQPHSIELAERLEGLNGITSKVIRDNGTDRSKIKLKSSTRKFFRDQSGGEQGTTNEPFMLVRNPDPTAIIAKRMDQLHFISVPDISAIAATTVDASLPVAAKGKEVTVTSLSFSSPQTTPLKEVPSPTRISSVVPIIRKPVHMAKIPQVASTISETARSSVFSTTVLDDSGPTPPITPQDEANPVLSMNTSEVVTPSLPSPAIPTRIQAISPTVSPSALPPGWKNADYRMVKCTS
ncbi:MAG: hypothetical protein GOMPHAMPRED_000018 [Gomphillus americanus]|uniref:Uncharacterized protein n=1 Tax=Gomphillus americanus TaxID=1940652 RepID=A0A8H3ECG7_9LECA|nr:MAG: hypothetical protein GOMPHAMPRED_000018 [Gomphillus americanus]